MANKIHPSAIVHPKASLDKDVEIGPYVVIEDDVVISSGTVVMAQAYIAKGSRIGKNNRIHMGAVIGHEPQDLAFQKEISSFTRIGDRNEIREFVTIHRGTKENSETVIGDDCFLMAASHVAHNCRIEDNVILANGALLAGYVHVGRNAFISGLVAIHQFVRIGAHTIISGQSAVNKDIPPFMLAGGRPCAVSAINLVGLRRAKFPKSDIENIAKYYKIIFRSHFNTSQALEVLKKEPANPHLKDLISFLEASERGLCTAAGLKDRN